MLRMELQRCGGKSDSDSCLAHLVDLDVSGDLKVGSYDSGYDGQFLASHSPAAKLKLQGSSSLSSLLGLLAEESHSPTFSGASPLSSLEQTTPSRKTRFGNQKAVEQTNKPRQQIPLSDRLADEVAFLDNMEGQMEAPISHARGGSASFMKNSKHWDITSDFEAGIGCFW